MVQKWQGPSDVKLVPNERIPDKLFVCLAKVKTEAGQALKGAFEGGKSLSKSLEASFNEHLTYAYELGENGTYWEAGPSADFTKILYIFSTDSLEKACESMRNDPFYKEGIFYDDWWMEWSVHTPIWKISSAMQEEMQGLMRGAGILPTYPPEVSPPVKEIEVEIITPPKLIVSFARANPERIKKIENDQKSGKPAPSFLFQHAFNRLGPGGTTAMGYDWEVGPSSDALYDLTIMSVGSMEMAQLLRENDPFTQHGLFYDPGYFEWQIHMPLRKASPTRTETLKKFLARAGVELAKE